MSSFKEIKLIGNLGRDPETHTFESGAQKTSFSVAVSEKYKNRAGEIIEETYWFSVDCFGKVSDIARDYLKKGHKVFISGAPKFRTYTTNDGEEKTIFFVNCQTIKILTAKNEGQRGSDRDHSQYQKQNETGLNTDGEPEDDLPF